MSEYKDASEIELSEQYDRDTDIYYVTVMTGEPSLVVEMEVTDNFVLEVGIFSGLPTGFRLLNFSKHRGDFGKVKNAFKQRCKQAGLQRLDDVKVRQQKFEQFLEKVEA